MLFRCSSIGKLMTEPKTKVEGPLSVGAKTYIRTLAAQTIFGIDFEVTSKEMEKGVMVEADAIQMLNRVRGLSLAKNIERRSNEWITGEADLFDTAARRGHDLKCSWSAATFPITVTDCRDSLYEWQMRGYMMLWDADVWEVNYALITTPESLTKWEPLFMHFVDHIPEHMRLTTWSIERDAEKEARMVEKIGHARAYFAEVVEEFERSHQPAKPIHILPTGTAMNNEQPEPVEQEAEAARKVREAAEEMARKREQEDADLLKQEEFRRMAQNNAMANAEDEVRPSWIDGGKEAVELARENAVLEQAAPLVRLTAIQESSVQIITSAGSKFTAPRDEDNGSRLTLGQINELLAPVSISVAGLSMLGFEPVQQVKASRLYRECDVPAICAAIATHVLARAKEEVA